MKYSTYPEYKDSGVEWFDGIPDHWNMGLLSTMFFDNKRKNKGMQETNLLSLSYGNIIRKDIQTTFGLLPESFEGYQVVQPDYIVLRLTDLQNDKKSLRTGYVTQKGIITSAYTALVPQSNHIGNTAFFHYYLHAFDINKGFYGMGAGVRQSLNFNELKKLRIATPPPEEQTIIANFLDQETAKIDTLISKQQKLISLLQEKRQAVISHAVTKGINPDAKMKDSGVEWLGDVPEHWLKSRLKYVVNQIIDTEHKTVHFVDDGKYLVARTANIRNGKLITKGAKYTNSEGYNGWTKRGIPKYGDIILTREAPAGEACIVPQTPVVCLGQRTVLIKKVEKVNSKYIVYSIYAGLSQEFIEQLSQGAIVVHFNMPDIGNIPLFEISKQEQNDIVRFLNNTTSKIDTLIAKATKVIELMRERRTALISAAVTGKIDVRNA